MKNTILITVFITLISVLGMTAQTDTYEIQVDGLGCPFCAYGLEKKFKEFKGIKKVKIEIETGDFTFEYPSDKAMSIDKVESQVEKAGYTPITTKITRADGSVETAGLTTNTNMDMASLSKGEIYVYGNCGMCEARIEKAAKSINGVANASWNQDNKMLTVNFDSATTNKGAIEMKISEVGHDTKNHKATKATYESLPACCKYERVNQ